MTVGWTTPAELLDMLKTGIALFCYGVLFAGVVWLINLIYEMVANEFKQRQKRKSEQAERERLNAYRRYNEYMAIINDPDYYGEP